MSEQKNPITMQLDRRRFLTQLLGFGVLPSAIASSLVWAEKKESQELVIGAQGSTEESYSMAWVGLKRSSSINSEQNQLNLVESNFRGHSVCQHPRYPARALMFSRRPGYQCIEVDVLNHRIHKVFDAGRDRHFFGHGCFNKTVSVLFTTEADINTGRGKIGIRDAISYKQIGEYESHGIGPHQLDLMPDGKTLVVANGGIHTHPKTGRKKLNLESMDSRLSYIDTQNGQLLDDFKVPESKASIRHLDVARDGTVAFAMQYQRDAVTHNNVIPLAGLHSPNRAIQVLSTPESLIQTMDDYIGSVCISQKHQVAGFTSPRGNVVAFWDIHSGALKGYHALADVCGIALSRDESHFTISNSFGQLRQINASTLVEDKNQRISLDKARWDNHLLIANIPS